MLPIFRRSEVNSAVYGQIVAAYHAEGRTYGGGRGLGRAQRCSEQTTPVQRKGRIKQSVSRWCYKETPLDQLCVYASQIGLKAIDLLNPEDYEVPRRYGLVCSMGYAGGGELSAPSTG